MGKLDDALATTKMAWDSTKILPFGSHAKLFGELSNICLLTSIAPFFSFSKWVHSIRDA